MLSKLDKLFNCAFYDNCAEKTCHSCFIYKNFIALQNWLERYKRSIHWGVIHRSK